MIKNLGFSLAVLALLGGAQAVKNYQKDEDLFTDEAAEVETLASIASSEKEHGKSFKGISAED